MLDKVTGWLITDGEFSPEALERADALQLYVSNWDACEALSEVLMNAFRGRSEAGGVSKARIRQCAREKSQRRQKGGTPPAAERGH